MNTTRQKIASGLDRRFAELGFAEQRTEALRAGADVSLRTLYKYFPSREAMVVGALEHRDLVYFDWLEGGPEDGVGHILYPFVRLGDWLAEVANTGCLFLNALAEHPDSAAIRDIVVAHKERIADDFRSRVHKVAPHANAGSIAETLFLLHEGMTQTARLHGRDPALAATLRIARAALAAEDIG